MAILSSTTAAHNELLLCSSYAVSEDATQANPGWYDNWQPWTDRSSPDSDRNSYYLGQYTYSNGTMLHRWWCKLKFTIPASAAIAKSNSLTLTIDIQGMSKADRIAAGEKDKDANGNPITPTEANYFWANPTRAFLTTWNSDTITNPNTYLTAWANNTDSGFIASTWMTDSEGDSTFYRRVYAYGQLTFTFTDLPPLQAGTTYYIYLMCYRYTTSAINSPRLQDSGFNGENLGSDAGDNSASSRDTRKRGYTTLVYDYQPGTVWINTGTESAPNWKRAIPWINTGTESAPNWQQAIPWIHNGTEWKLSGG